MSMFYASIGLVGGQTPSRTAHSCLWEAWVQFPATSPGEVHHVFVTLFLLLHSVALGIEAMHPWYTSPHD